MNARPTGLGFFLSLLFGQRRCRRWAWLLSLFVVGNLEAAGSPLAPEEWVAATTDLTEPVGISDYEISLRTDLEQNRVWLEATCTVRNQGDAAATTLHFDILKAEEEYGAKVNVENVWYIHDGTRRPCTFKRAILESENDLKDETNRQPLRILQVELASPLLPATERRLVFDYSITVADPAKDTGYRLIAQLPSGEKEVCLMDDFSWLPRPFQKAAGKLSLGERNFFTRGTPSAWRISLTHPSKLASLVLDGRMESAKRAGEAQVSQYRSVRTSRPQLLIGPCDRVEIPGHSVAVVFLLPKEKYTRREIENSAAFFQLAIEFYRDRFGPLEGKPLHVAISSAGMGGHGAFLGMFLDSLPAKEPGAYDDDAAHELAHSWGVSSYGRGTKFLRESFSNFAAWHLARTAFHKDRFPYEAVRLACYGLLSRPLFQPTADVQKAAYTKGTVVMDLLRQEMGDRAFFGMWGRFRTKYVNSPASFADFVATCNEVTGRDWLPFLTHWCYGSGIPVYHLAGFRSLEASNRWETTVTFTNAGKGVVTCPVDLQTCAGAQRMRFAVSEGQSGDFVWETSAQVTNVVIDPDHTCLQGDATELGRKLLALPDTIISENWPLYWRTVAHASAGEYAEAERLLSRAIDVYEELEEPAPARVTNPFYYTRAVVRLRTGQATQAAADLRNFLDGSLQPANDHPAAAEEVTEDLAYAQLLTATTLDGRLQQMRELLNLITGADLPVGTGFTEWRQWWKAHRSGFELGREVGRLSPGGIPSP